MAKKPAKKTKSKSKRKAAAIQGDQDQTLAQESQGQQLASTVPFRDHNGTVAPSSDFPQNSEGLLQDGYQHTHTAPNGNKLYTRHHAKHGHVYVEVDNEGKVVEARTNVTPHKPTNAGNE